MKNSYNTQTSSQSHWPGSDIPGKNVDRQRQNMLWIPLVQWIDEWMLR